MFSNNQANHLGGAIYAQHVVLKQNENITLFSENNAGGAEPLQQQRAILLPLNQLSLQIIPQINWEEVLYT